jgi:hypothetical protein
MRVVEFNHFSGIEFFRLVYSQGKLSHQHLIQPKELYMPDR